MNSLQVILFLNGLVLICLYISIAIVCIQLNGFKYSYQTLIIEFKINNLPAHSEVVSSAAYTNSFICSQFQSILSISMNINCSIQHYSFVWFGLVWFCGISTIVDYSMPNPFYTYIFHHHHVILSERISLTLSRHPSLSSIASGRSSG